MQQEENDGDRPVPVEVIPLLREIINSIVDKQYDCIAANGYLGRVTVQEIERVIEQMREGTLVDLPEEVWSSVPEAYSYPFYGNDAEEWMVDIPLWTEEHGRSDLTLTVLITKLASGYTAGIFDLHIL